jgi:carboxymethylenebutenolidase
MIESVIQLDTGEGIQTVLAKHPDEHGPFPVVVMFHDGPGMREATHEVMRRIAQEGYYVVAPDRYHRLGEQLNVEPAEMFKPGNEELRNRMFGWLMGTSEDSVATDLAALLAHLATDPAATDGPRGCVGYCIGARSVLRSLKDHPEAFAAGATFHPSFCVTEDDDSPHQVVSIFTGEIYVGIGSEDRLQSVAMNQPFLDAVNAMADGRGLAEVHEGADHGFGVPGPAYHAVAADRSYDMMLAMFDRTLG